MNESHLDPDIHLWPLATDTEYHVLMEALKGWDTGRWDWDGIDICTTGKYADLDPWGQQGVKINGLDSDSVYFTAHIGKTICGEPCFDISEDEVTEEEYEFLRQYFLDIAQEIVWDMGMAGDWSGDDWYMHESFGGRVGLCYTDDEFDAEKTCVALLNRAESLLADCEDACRNAAKQIDDLYDAILKDYRKIIDAYMEQES